MLYSSELSKNVKPLGVHVQQCIIEIKNYFHLGDVNVLKYDEFSVAIPVVIQVSIPPHGTVGGIDIRSTEPILIRLFLDLYPYAIPFILSDRKDFPKTQLSHLYLNNDNKPAGLCLVRNDPQEWFSNKKISDLLHVVEEWFFKAGAGLLNEDGDEFDPIRLEGYQGYHFYKYQTLYEIVTKNEGFLTNNSFAILLASVTKDSLEGEITYRSLNAIPYIQMETLLKLLSDVSEKINLDKVPEKPVFSILLWANELKVENEYWANLPKNYGELKKLLNERGIDIDKILEIYSTSKLDRINGIPIILAIKRPRKMIGFDGDIEFINFSISGENFTGKNMSNTAQVRILKHIELFSSDLAKMVSGQKRNKNLLFIGAGSLGSKMIIHEARSGNLNMSIIDHDDFLQHNLVRHALYNNKTGKNKAEAMVEEINSLFKADLHPKLKAHSNRVVFLTPKDLNDIEWVIDTTASFGVQNWISRTDLLNNKNIARCELVDDASLGIVYIEGADRNPRTDDLVSLVYYEALNTEFIEKWLVNDSKRELTNLNVGLGCSSTTVITADDLISSHAATFSKVLYNEYERKNIGSDGLIFMNKVENTGLINISSKNIIVKPFLILSCGNNSGWEVRIRRGVEEEIFDLVKKAEKNETGGVLIGTANYKTKIIHVLDIIKATIDSQGTPGRFKRGIKNLPEQINQIKEKTGNMLGYIGEWHSHPMGLEKLSDIDLENIQTLQKENGKVPIPTFAIIIANEKILPFIFN